MKGVHKLRIAIALTVAFTILSALALSSNVFAAESDAGAPTAEVVSNPPQTAAKPPQSTSPEPLQISAEVPSSASEEATASEIIIAAQSVLQNWNTIGWLAAVVAFLQLLIKMLKFGPVNRWFVSRQKKWLKPYIAIGLGMLLGGFSTYATGVGVLNSLVAGFMLGTSSVGWNELVGKTFSAKKRAR